MSEGASEAATFQADLAKMNAALHKLGAVVTFEDGARGVDPERVPAALLSAYNGLVCFGYARGLIGGTDEH